MPDLPIVIGSDRVVALTNMHADMHVVRNIFDHLIDHSHGGSTLALSGGSEVSFVNLDMLASGRGQLLEILPQQLAEVRHHSGRIVIIFVISYRRQQMRPCHGYLDLLARKRRHGSEFFYETQVDGVENRAPANCRRMKYVRIMPRNRFRLSLPLKGWNLLPEMI